MQQIHQRFSHWLCWDEAAHSFVGEKVLADFSGAIESAVVVALPRQKGYGYRLFDDGVRRFPPSHLIPFDGVHWLSATRTNIERLQSQDGVLVGNLSNRYSRGSRFEGIEVTGFDGKDNPYWRLASEPDLSVDGLRLHSVGLVPSPPAPGLPGRSTNQTGV